MIQNRMQADTMHMSPDIGQKHTSAFSPTLPAATYSQQRSHQQAPSMAIIFMIRISYVNNISRLRFLARLICLLRLS